MTTLVLITLTTLGVSAACSLFEAVLYSVRTPSLEAARTRPGRTAARARRMLAMKKHIAPSLAAILIMNTLANTAGATWAGRTSAELFAPRQVLLYSIGLTVGILFLSEILPKTVGAVHWRGLWPFVVWPITALRIVLQPLIWTTQKLSGFISHGQDLGAITEEELLAMVDLSTSAGHLGARERELVRNVVGLDQKIARDILTPRTVMFILDAGLTVADAVPRMVEAGFSRVPLYENHPENIVGYALSRDLYAAREKAADTPLRALVKPVAFVPDSANCLALLGQFLRHRRHIAMVSDEYGGLAGMVTLEDLVETVLGAEIVDETDREVDMREAAQRQGARREANPGRPGGRPPA